MLYLGIKLNKTDITSCMQKKRKGAFTVDVSNGEPSRDLTGVVCKSFSERYLSN